MAARSDSETPRVDAALRNPLATPPQVAAWLRARERELIAARALVANAVRDAASRGEPSNASLRAAVTDLDRALDDREGGALPRVLRRPLRQLVPGTPACATLERLTTRLVARAEAAARLQPLLTQLWTRLDALRTRYVGTFPTFLHRELAAAGIDDGAIARLRGADEAEFLLQRLARAADRMDAWAHDAGPDWAAAAIAAGEPLRAAELGAVTTRGLRERARLVARHERAGQTRAMLARHAAMMRQLAASAGAENATTAPPDDLAFAVGDLLLAATRLGPVNAIGAADAPLWAWALNGAASGREAAWGSGDTAAPPTTADRASPETTLYIVPIVLSEGEGGREHDALAWITPHLPSAIRVWSERVALGATLDGRIAVPDAADFDPVAERDLAALYDGVASARSAWYRTTTDVRLDAVARCGDAWVARVTRRGAVSVTERPAWNALPGPAGTFRLLRPAPSRGNRGAPLEVEELGEAGTAFAGASTREVRTALAGDGRAWLRVPVPDDPGARAALDREHALFDEMARAPSMAAVALTPLGFARRTRHETPLPLYRRPLATGPGLGEALGGLGRAWLRDVGARSALIAAIARALVAVHRAGAAIGVVHPAAFAYGLRYSPITHGAAPDDADPAASASALVPHAVLVSAPCATPLGLRFDAEWARAARGRDGDFMLPRLRVSAAAGAARAGDVATRGADAAAFVRCAIDLLALDPVGPSEHGEGHLAARLRAQGAQFVAPTFALHLAELADGGDHDAMVRLLDGIAGGSATTA